MEEERGKPAKVKLVVDHQNSSTKKTSASHNLAKFVQSRHLFS